MRCEGPPPVPLCVWRVSSHGWRRHVIPFLIRQGQFFPFRLGNRSLVLSFFRKEKTKKVQFSSCFQERVPPFLKHLIEVVCQFPYLENIIPISPPGKKVFIPSSVWQRSDIHLPFVLIRGRGRPSLLAGGRGFSIKSVDQSCERAMINAHAWGSSGRARRSSGPTLALRDRRSKSSNRFRMQERGLWIIWNFGKWTALFIFHFLLFCARCKLREWARSFSLVRFVESWSKQDRAEERSIQQEVTDDEGLTYLEYTNLEKIYIWRD